MEHTPGYPMINHATFGRAVPPSAPEAGQKVGVPCAKVLGGARGRAKAFRPKSIVNISGMSFGSLSGNAVEALNRGAALAGCLQNTGEGGLARYHRHGGELIFQIGTAYFGCRDEEGRFDLERLKDVVAGAPVRALEIKLTQGAKPGLGGLLPAAKVSAEIAAAAGHPGGPGLHQPVAARRVQRRGQPAGLGGTAGGGDGPAGGHQVGGRRSRLLARAGRSDGGETGRGVDFMRIDGGEGGTGAAPLIFTDTVSLPFQLGLRPGVPVFAERGLQEGVVWIGGGKLGLPDNAVVGLRTRLRHDERGPGGDARRSGASRLRSATPTAAQRGWPPRTRGWRAAWYPTLKSVRVANYIRTLRRDLLKVAEACGVEHPGLISTDSVDILDGRTGATPLHDVYGYTVGMGLPSAADREEIVR